MNEFEYIHPLVNDLMSFPFAGRDLEGWAPLKSTPSIKIWINRPVPTVVQDALVVLHHALVTTFAEELGLDIAIVERDLRVRLEAIRRGSLELETSVELTPELRMTLDSSQKSESGLVAKALRKLRDTVLAASLGFNVISVELPGIKVGGPQPCDFAHRPLEKQVEQMVRRMPPETVVNYHYQCGPESISFPISRQPSQPRPGGDWEFPDQP